MLRGGARVAERSSSSNIIGFAVAVIIAVVAVGTSVDAQFWARNTNPRVEVELQHPPGLDIRVDTVAFGPASGRCSDQIIQELVADFVSNGLRVVDRQRINRLLSENDLALGGHFDSSTAAEIGRLIGPSAMIMVDVQRCVSERDRIRGELRSEGGNFLRGLLRDSSRERYHSRTRVFVDASVRAIDLTTGRIFAARSLNHSPEETYSSSEGYPEYPSEFEVFDAAYGLVVRDIHRMFLPWTEHKELVYFDDKDCNLNDAHRALESGNTERALDVSIRNLERCRANPRVDEKDLGQAYYNVGVTHMILGNYDEALENLSVSAELRPGDIVEEAITDVSRARDLLVEMRQVEESFQAFAAEFEGTDSSESQKSGSAAAAVEILTNADVVTMTAQSLPEAIILAKISTSTCEFDTSPKGLAALNQAGVSQNVILAMLTAN